MKLLTYVSIFYLPLSFCVALWSINENYSRPPLIITTVLVGFATYFLLANMHNIDVMRRTFVYDFVGRKVLQKMRGQGKGTKWEERAGELRGFRVEERTGGISKWMVLRFWGGVRVGRTSRGCSAKGVKRWRLQIVSRACQQHDEKTTAQQTILDLGTIFLHLCVKCGCWVYIIERASNVLW